MSDKRRFHFAIADEWRPQLDKGQCSSGKNCFTNAKYGVNQIRKMRNDGENVAGLEPYLCDECGYYHIGHQTTFLKVRKHERIVEQLAGS